MKLFIKFFLIVLSLSCWSSFAVKGNYNSLLKKDITKVRTFSEFQRGIQKDLLEMRRDLATQPVLAATKETIEKNDTKKSNPSSI